MSMTEATVTNEQLSEGLLRAVLPMHRLLRRRVREDWPLEPLPSAQVSMLVAVRQRPGMSVGEAAAELRVAPNTASTLANQLAAAGLLERAADERDRRTIRLRPTHAAQARLDAWQDRRRQVLEGALDGLSERDRAAIAAAMPGLVRLARGLDR
jgi:DNA-binding MarR family transcriptional regulator